MRIYPICIDHFLSFLFSYGSGSIVRKLMEMATTQTLFCRMDYQNGSAWRNEQDEAGRSCRNECEGNGWKTDDSKTQKYNLFLNRLSPEKSSKNLFQSFFVWHYVPWFE